MLRCDPIILIFVVICVESLEQSICIGLFVGVRCFGLTAEHTSHVSRQYERPKRNRHGNPIWPKGGELEKKCVCCPSELDRL